MRAEFIKDGKATYVYNFLGLKEQRFVAPDALTAGKHVIGVSFEKEGQDKTGEFTGKLSLHVDDQVVAEGPMITQPGFFSLTGEGLCVGRDSADPVTKEYGPGFNFTGGTIAQVEFNVSGEPYVNLEREAAAVYERD